MIYVQTGLRTNKLKEFKSELSAFDWVKDYQHKNVTGDTSAFKRDSADYFISGYIEPNDNGQYVRSNNSLIRRDLIVMDYDDLHSAEDFENKVHQSLSNYQYMLYTTISHTQNNPRYRLIVEPSRPILQHEYKTIQNEISEKIGLKTDTSATTWSQLQGLPVAPIEVVNKGEKYPVKDNIPIDEPKVSHQPINDVSGAKSCYIERDKALEMIIKYVEADSSNLQDYNNSLSAIAVIAKSVKDNVINYETASECVQILAMGNADWASGNIEKLNDFLGNQDIRTHATFVDKFHNMIFKKPKTMKELKKLLFLQGEEKRMELSTEDKDGNIKVKPLSARTVANILYKHCTVVLIGEDDPEKSPLAIYDLDSGIYRKGERFIRRLTLSVQGTLTPNECKNVEHFLINGFDTKEVSLTQDKNLIVCNNGIYNKMEKRLMPFSSDYIFINKIATNYVENAKEPTFNDWKFSKWLYELSDGDSNKLQLLWQVMQSAIDSNNISEICVFLLSKEGSTGKSTFELLLKELVGSQNTYALKIKEFEQDFKIAEAYGKSLIIGDDNNPKDYNESSENFKSAITGELLLLNPKGRAPFTAQLRALSVQSMNGIPRFSDVSGGMLRRIRVIKFNHVYKGVTKNRRIKEEYIKNKHLLEYILFQCLKLDVEEFVNTQESIETVRELKLENDKIEQFYEETLPELRSEHLPSIFLFSLFQAWCDKVMNVNAKMGRNTFTRESKEVLEQHGYNYEAKNYRPYPYFSDYDLKLFEDWGAYNYYPTIKIHQYQPLFKHQSTYNENVKNE